MQNRSEFLTLIAEVRGRLNELENLVQFGSNYAVPSPQAFEESGVEDITPRGYGQFRSTGLKQKDSLLPLTPLSDFVQFAAPMKDSKCDVADFLVSDLHCNDSTPAYGLTMIPEGDQQDWFAFELLCPDLGSGFIARTGPQPLRRKRIGRLWGTCRIESRPFASP